MGTFQPAMAVRTNVAGANGAISDGFLLSAALAEARAAELLVEHVDIYDSGSIELVGDVAGTYTDSLRKHFLGLGWSLSMDATAAEDTDVTLSNVSNAYADVKVVRRALGISATQLLMMVDPTNFDPEVLAQTMVGSFRLGRMKALITTLQSLSGTTVDGTAYNDIDDLFTVIDAAAALGIDPGTPIYMLMHYAGQWARIRDSLRAEVGPLGLREDVKDLFSAGAFGATAELLRSVRVWTTARITAGASKYTGAWWVPGAIGYAIGSPRAVVTNALMRSPGVPMVVSWKDEPGSATIKIYGNGYDGSAVLRQYGGLFKGKE